MTTSRLLPLPYWARKVYSKLVISTEAIYIPKTTMLKQQLSDQDFRVSVAMAMSMTLCHLILSFKPDFKSIVSSSI